jgi:hypothetical protein
VGCGVGCAARAHWPGASGSMVLSNPLLLPPIVLDLLAVLVIDTRLRTGGACVVVMDVAAMGMGMAIVPVNKFLDWGWRVCGA